MKMYPSDYKPATPIPLQSYLFGHRIKDSQTKYEYLIEFLQVAISPKALEYNNKQFFRWTVKTVIIVCSISLCLASG